MKMMLRASFEGRLQLRADAVHQQMDLWLQMASLRVDRPDRLRLGPVLPEQFHQAAIFKIRRDIEERQLADAFSRKQSIQNGRA